ncbi:MAG: hypothetical protein KIT58_15560 [Planctomycetota bacterium]|nr:hypothetical protein [Planctomycetota bacterium]
MIDLQLAPTPCDELLRRGPMRVLRYRASTPRLPVPVVLVPSIINRSYVFDLRPGQSLVEALLGAGLDVVLVDWGVPAQADARLGLGDYALGLLGRPSTQRWRRAARRRRTCSAASAARSR